MGEVFWSFSKGFTAKNFFSYQRILFVLFQRHTYMGRCFLSCLFSWTQVCLDTLYSLLRRSVFNFKLDHYSTFDHNNVEKFSL